MTSFEGKCDCSKTLQFNSFIGIIVLSTTNRSQSQVVKICDKRDIGEELEEK